MGQGAKRHRHRRLKHLTTLVSGDRGAMPEWGGGGGGGGGGAGGGSWAGVLDLPTRSILRHATFSSRRDETPKSHGYEAPWARFPGFAVLYE